MFPVVGLESSQNPTNGYVGRGLCSKNSKSCEIKLSGANTFAPVNFSYCTDDELYELCSAVTELGSVTSWSCDECQKRFKPDCGFYSDESICKKHFFEMNKPE